MNKKIKFGIDGLDDMLIGPDSESADEEKGIWKGKPYLLYGCPGTGKTILAWQFLLEGLREKENVLYITLEERIEDIQHNMESLGIKNENVSILEISPTFGEETFDYFFESRLYKNGEIHEIKIFPKQTTIGGIQFMKLFSKALEEIIKKESKIDRIVIDSLTSIKLVEKDKENAKRVVQALMNYLMELGCTSLLISQLAKTETESVEHFLANGIIKMDIYINKKSFEQHHIIGIEKMRGMAFDKKYRIIEISKKNKGIKVKKGDISLEDYLYNY